MKPTIGRIVHFVYHAPGLEAAPRCYAAIVTDICEVPCGIDHEGFCVDLDVRHRHASRFVDHMSYCDDTSQIYTWHWPERTES